MSQVVDAISEELRELRKQKKRLKELRLLQNEVDTLENEIVGVTDFDSKRMLIIRKVVCQHFRLKPYLLMGSRRNHWLCFARYTAWNFTRDVTLVSYERIGKFYGDRDHGTILHGIKAFNNRYDTDGHFKSDMDALELKIKKEIRKANGKA